MISINRGTQAFSTAQQDSQFKADTKNDMSVGEREKALGDKDLGEVLNKIADPNWVDPSKMRKTGKNELDKESFLKLLLTQLKNQDPTSPMESHDMAAQLAQFSSLEQLNNINSSIGDLAKAQNPGQNYDTLSMIGKTVAGDSSKIIRSDHSDVHEVNFNILENANKVTAEVKDLAGNVVKELEFNDLKKGKNTITWDGKMDDGSSARQGEYRIEFKAKSSAGANVYVATKFKGTVTGINYQPSGPVLMLGNQSLKLSDVQMISSPEILNAQRARAAAMPKAKAAPANKSDKKVEVKPEKGAKPAPAPGNGLSDIAMSRGMVNKMKSTGVDTGTAY